MEKSKPVDQRRADPNPGAAESLHRYHRARTFVLANARLFATQGSIVATWRVRRGKRFGPYYRLAYRRNGRQRSIYLGPSNIAEPLREFLVELQLPHRRRQLSKRLQASARASLKQAKKHLAQLLAPFGVTVKGYEFRGAARAFGRSRCSPLRL